CFLETDSQGSIKDFIEERQANASLSEIPYYECYTDIPAMVQKLAARFDYVFVDTPGMKSPAFVKALSCADIVLTFVEPGSGIEINTLGRLVFDIKTAQAGVNPSMKAWIVLNKCATNPSDSEASELRNQLNDDPDWLPVPRQRIYMRTAHKKAYNCGMGVHEYNDKRGNKARGEIELLLKE
ncbi:TPA: peptidyl-arginine deiminase, partial [Escherichia coli]|nr:peptidyl-arginine deiminase [Escherichia coli]